VQSITKTFLAYSKDPLGLNYDIIIQPLGLGGGRGLGSIFGSLITKRTFGIKKKKIGF
jgi:hypothetical protein